MPHATLTRVELARHSVVAVLALALFGALLLAAAAPASAITRKQAARKALAALGSSHRSAPVIVFGLRNPVRAGTRVTQARTRRPWTLRGAAVKAVRAPLVVKAGRERAFFFYEDAGPFRPYPHPGRVALVGARSGKVKLSRTIVWPPLVNGRLPRFLTSWKRYESSTDQVFSQPLESPEQQQQPASSPFGPLGPVVPAGTTPNSPPKADSQTVTAKQGAPKRVTLTGSDDNGDLLTFHITKEPLRGTLSGQPPDVVYTPNPGYLGPDHFTFKTSDGDAESNAAQVSIAVVPLGSPPSVTTSSGCTAYTEQAPAVAVDDQLTVSDPDDATLDGATVRISANFQGGGDLVFTDQNGISGSYNDNTGTLTLTGTASVAAYEAALRSVGYRNLASGNPTATKDVEFTVNDGGSDSAPATKQICITGGAGGANDPPIGETGEGALSYVENDGPVLLDGGFVVGDPDSANLSGATIKFVPVVSQAVDENGDPVGSPVSTVTFAPAEDGLAFADQNGITGSYDDSTGVLTLTGSASVADYETAIRSVTYENSSEDPSDAQRRLEFQVTDSGGASSTPSRRDIFVTPVNDAPTVTTAAGATSYTGADPPVAIDAGLTAGDVDDDDLEGAVVTIASGFAPGDQLGFTDQNGITGFYSHGLGVLTLTGTASVAHYQAALRSITYSSTGNPSGSRTVEFKVNDGDLDSDVATKTLELNDKPVLDTTDAALAYTENAGPVAVDSGIAATDADSTSLSGATVQITGGFVSGEDALAFTDQNGITGSYDAESALLTLSGTASVADYQAALRSVTYENSSEDPSAATRTVTFQADDGAAHNNLSDPATRDVAVTPVNDAPAVTTSAGAVSYTEGDAATAVDSASTVADVDDANLESAQVRISSGFQSGDELVFADQSGIVGGYDSGTGVLTLTGSASVADYQTALRSVQYRHTGDAPSTAKTVELEVNDGDADSAAATKDVTVTAVNDAPVLDTTDTALSYSENAGAVAVDAGIAASDPDSADLTGATVQISSNFSSAQDDLAFADQNGITGAYDDATGVLTLTGTASVADYQAALRSVTYENSSDSPSTATRTVTFQVDDGALDSNAATRDVAVTAVNDAPVVTASAGSTSYAEGDPATAVDSGLTVTDVDDTSLEGAQVRISSGFEAGDELAFADQSGITGSYDPATGVLTLTGTASVADYETALRSIGYGHPGDAPSASKTVEFKVNDGDVDSNAASKSVDVVASP